MDALTTAHGGILINNYLSPEDKDNFNNILEKAIHAPSHTLSQRQFCDLELLLNGTFSPLTGFMGQDDYETVLQGMRLSEHYDHLLWPIPIVLDVSHRFADSLKLPCDIILRDAMGFMIAIMTVTEKWEADKSKEAVCIYNTEDHHHAGVDYLLYHTQPVYLGGKVQGLYPPKHFDFVHLRHSPDELRTLFSKLGWSKVVAFQTRNPMHKAHMAITQAAIEQTEASLLLHPSVGMTKMADVDAYTRVRCYEKILQHYPEQTTLLSILPSAMRFAGPREAILHSIIRQNYGCSHIIIGRHHASPSAYKKQEFYQAYEAQALISQHSTELNITMLPMPEMVYAPSRGQYIEIDKLDKNEQHVPLSGTELRKRLKAGSDIPEWFTFPEILAELQKVYRPRSEQGLCLFFTGLPSAGKSTLAHAVKNKLLEIGTRTVTLLDGDIVRQHLSSELGFSKQDRDINVRRIGFVAKEITKHGGCAICAPIAPYEKTREHIREMISAVGGFIEIYVSTPLDICESRDQKGWYQKAKQGKIEHFTGLDDPYEIPAEPDLTLDMTGLSPEKAVQDILLKLEALGYI